LPMAVLVVFSTIAGALTTTAGLMLVFNALDTEDFSNDKVVDLIDDKWWWWVIAFALAIAGLVAQMKVITRMRWTSRQAWDNSWRPGPPPAIA
jgi:NADH:ubiquinone oxidoreductase subunit 5 (subunit L)/multisubunit Na+/H+ antiporter MnhA subunit